MTNNSTDFVRWLRIETCKAELQQKELAIQAGLSKNTVSKYFLGAWLPSLSNYKSICEVIAENQKYIYGLSRKEAKNLLSSLILEGIKAL